VISAEIDEPQAGSAATASAWLCLEQPGPWGRDALLSSHLDRELGAELSRRAAGTGVRILLIRRPGRHADRHMPSRRRVYLASTAPGATWLEQADLAHPEELLELDFAALGAGRSTGFGVPVDSPLLLLCSNGRRDVCCALFGRPIAAALAESHPGAVWECTHTGGHRFAPTGVLLPSGYLYGRLDGGFAEHVLDEAALGRIVTQRCRGRSCWSPPGQAAELAVRERIGETADVLVVSDEQHLSDGSWAVNVCHRDGRQWLVVLQERSLPARPASCGKQPDVPTVLVAASVDELVAVG
jgi:hypothetical protein